MSEDTVTAISTAIIAAISAWIVAHYSINRSAKKDVRERKELQEREARYLAIRVVCELDPLIYACCSVSTDSGRTGGDGVHKAATKLPSISLPTDVDWRSLDPDLMYRVLSLPNEIAAANQSIASTMDHIATPPDYPEYFHQRRMSYARLGLCALTLADDLRTRFAIAAREDRDEDPEDHLNDALAKELREELLESPMGALVRQQETRAVLKASGIVTDDGD